MNKLCFIGAGNMGSAMISGVVKSKLIDRNKIFVSNKSEKKLNDLKEEWEVNTTTDNKEACENSDVVVLAVKPHIISSVLEEIKDVINKEAILTYQIERTYTKDEILERYLNEIYFGSGSYGIRNAAEQYFKKDVKDLNIAEAALLAGIPNRPTKYDPNRNLENALYRQKIILKEMYTDGRITKEQYDEALAYKFELENEENIKNVPKNTSIIYNKRTKNYI